MWRPRRLRAARLALGLGAVLAWRLPAQGLLTVTPGQGQVGVAAEGTWHRVPGARTAAGGDYREWIRLPFGGTLVSPRFLSWAATVQPTLQQRTETGFDRTLAARQLDLALLGRLLADRPLHLTTSYTRASATTSGGYGSDRDVLFTALGGDLGWRNPYLPMHLSLSRRTTDERWRPTPASPRFRTDQLARQLRFNAANSKLSLDASRLAFDDRVTGTALDATAATGRHQLRWGKGSRLQSTVEYQRETGLYDSRRTTWGEQLRLQHTRQVGTSWFYRRSTSRVDALQSAGTAFGGGTDVRATRWLTLGLDGAQYRGAVARSAERLTTVTPRAALALAAGRGRLTASVSAAHEARRREGPSPGSGLALDEAYTVPLARRGTLQQPDVVSGSVRIADAGGTVVYVEGVDYVLLTVGRLTSVDVPVGGLIQPGDGLRVTYRYLLPAVDASGAAWRVEYEGTAQYRGFSLRHQRSLRTVGSTRGTPGLLAPGSDFDERRTTLAARSGTPVGRVEVEAGLRETDRFGQQTTEQTFTAGWSPPAARRVQVAFNATWSRIASEADVARALSGAATASVQPAGPLRVVATLEAFRWRQTGLPTQHFLAATVGGEMTLGQLDLSLRLEQHRRDFLFVTDTRRVTARVLRRF